MTGMLPPGAASDAPTPDAVGVREETSLYGFVNVLLRYRRMIALLVLLFGGYGTTRFLQEKPTFTTRLWISVGQVSGRAAQLAALAGGGTISTPDVEFYTELLRSGPLLREAAEGPYTVSTGKGSVTGSLPSLLGLTGPSSVHAEEMIRYLTRNIRLSSSSHTGNMWIFVGTPYPELSQQVGLRLVALLNDYAARKHASRAAAERRFIAGRLATARAELAGAEGNTLRFRLNNRDISSPALAMEEERLQRELGIRQQSYTSLLQTYDRARIEEAKDIPAITILEAPEKPLKPERSKSASVPLLAAISGLLVGIVVAFIRVRLLDLARSPTTAFDEYRELKRQTAQDFRNPFRGLIRPSRPPNG